MSDLISRKDAIDKTDMLFKETNTETLDFMRIGYNHAVADCIAILKNLPSAQPTLYGYNIEHLELIARVLQKENLSPERVVEILTDIGRIVAIVRDEFGETLRKAVEQCMT